MRKNAPKILALTTCHNRCDLTVRSIQSLLAQKLSSTVELSIVVVDDGSTDKTAQKVKLISRNITVIKGTGTLYWAGGMRYGWEKWVKDQDFDFLLVFNDDVVFYDFALSTLLRDFSETGKQGPDLRIVSGAFNDPESNELTYGGFKSISKIHPLRFKLVTPRGTPRKVDTLNMNAALIPKSVLSKIGFLEQYFTHSGADTEFGLRLKKNFGQVWLSGYYIGSCARNIELSPAAHDKMGIVEKFNRLINVKNEPIKVRFYFFKKYGGFLWLILFCGPYCRILFDASVKRLNPLRLFFTK